LFDQQVLLTSQMSIKQLLGRLIQSPFSLSQKTALLLTRYLIESNNEEFTMFNLDETASLAVIKSRLRFVIGSVHLLSSEEEVALQNQVSAVRTSRGLSQIIVRNEQQFKAQISAFPDVSKAGNISLVQLNQLFKLSRTVFTAAQHEYIILRLFEDTNSK